jgi:hypothetical protein
MNSSLAFATTIVLPASATPPNVRKIEANTGKSNVAATRCRSERIFGAI